uniref:Uncharacterized protein n=1 Tax=Heterorhabditis bacteriophora TaxID=37862 RepID=A0A1I7X2Z1_HETBA
MKIKWLRLCYFSTFWNISDILLLVVRLRGFSI